MLSLRIFLALFFLVLATIGLPIAPIPEPCHSDRPRIGRDYAPFDNYLTHGAEGRTDLILAEEHGDIYTSMPTYGFVWPLSCAVGSGGAGSETGVDGFTCMLVEGLCQNVNSKPVTCRYTFPKCSHAVTIVPENPTLAYRLVCQPGFPARSYHEANNHATFDRLE
ncbi:hypothetical protein ANO11243_032290 [Dothideomycetidae sp. 11243]|nr:hypothetical protein ANO11243_032290 [fungal sp. No.11243]